MSRGATGGSNKQAGCLVKSHAKSRKVYSEAYRMPYGKAYQEWREKDGKVYQEWPV